MDWMQTNDAADLLGISISQVRAEVKAGRMHGVHVGRRLLVDRAEVLRLKAQREHMVSLAEAARILGISYYLVKKAVTTGVIPCETDRGRYYIRRDDLPGIKEEEKGI